MIVDPHVAEPPETVAPASRLSIAHAHPAASADPPAVLLVCPIAGGAETVVALVGEADISTAGQLRDQFAEMLATRPRSLLVDVSSLDFCDLSGLDALGEAASAATAAGLGMTLQGCSPQLSWLLDTFAPRSGVRPAHGSGGSGPVPQAWQRSTSGPEV